MEQARNTAYICEKPRLRQGYVDAQEAYLRSLVSAFAAGIHILWTWI